MRKRLPVILTLLFIAFASVAQSSSDTVQSDEKDLPKEKVEGLLPVLGYFGSKLVNELGQRFNVESEKEKGEMTEVQVELGWIKFTRREER